MAVTDFMEDAWQAGFSNPQDYIDNLCREAGNYSGGADEDYLINKIKDNLVELNSILKGNIKSLIETEFNDKIIMLFNDNMNKIEEKYYKKYTGYKSKILYKYNENGNKIEVEYYDKIKLILKRIFIYNESGFNIEMTHYKPDRDWEKIKYIYEYDDRGNYIGYKEYDPNGLLISKAKFIYNNNGKIIKRIWDNAYQIDTLKYDYKGNIIELEKCYNAYQYEKQFDIYDPREVIFQPKQADKFIYKYNENDNIIEINLSDYQSNLKEKFTLEYDYDEKNNWIKRTIKGGVFNITEREFEYY